MTKQNKFKLAASLICGNMLNLQGDIDELNKAKVDSIHFDVMDGLFVPRYGLHPEVLSSVRTQTNIPIDVHLMVENPEPYFNDFLKAGATTLTFHYEATAHAHRLTKIIKNAGVKAGVALNPATPLHALDYLLEDVDLILIMAINPGIVGHKLIPEMIQKIKDLKNKIGNRKIEIEIDGGVTPESSPKMIEAGATMLVCGTGTIYQPPALLSDKISDLKETINRNLS
jgi:ribulose-phosphate 3-epimerase